MRAVLDPDATDARAKRRQAELLAQYGGRDKALARRSGLYACAECNRRDQLDLIGVWLAALSRGEFLALLRRCHRLRSLTRSAPASSLPENHCATTTGRLLEGVRSRLACPRPVIVDPYASVTCAATSNAMAAQSDVVGLEKTGARASELVVMCYANYARAVASVAWWHPELGLVRRPVPIIPVWLTKCLFMYKTQTTIELLQEAVTRNHARRPQCRFAN